MAKFNHIIYLDEEGTCLSPYAEVITKWKLSTLHEDRLEISSKGNVVLFAEPANQKIAELVRIKGLSLEGYQAKELDGSEFSDSTLILTFTAETKQQVYDRFPQAANVYMIREFVGEIGDIRLQIGGSIEEYDAVCAVVDRVIDRLLEKILEL